MPREIVVKHCPDFAGKLASVFPVLSALRVAFSQQAGTTFFVAGVSLVRSTRVVPLFRLLNCYVVKAVNPR